MSDTPTPQRLALLDASCEAAERLLLCGFKQLESGSQCAWDDLDKAVDILARLTAVRKSLIHESDRPAPKPPAPQPSSSDRSERSDRSNRSEWSDSAAPKLQVSAVHPIHALHAIRDIPAMPLNRIEPVLNRVMTDLQPWERRSPERPNTQSDTVTPSDPDPTDSTPSPRPTILQSVPAPTPTPVNTS